MTDPNGNVSFTVYNDPNHEVRVYRGWNATTGTTTGPIEVQREYRPVSGAPSTQRTVYRESLTLAAMPTTSGTAGSLVPTGLETITATGVQSLERRLTNDAGQTTQVDQYFSTLTMTYATATPTLGSASNSSASGNYHSKQIDYDGRGRLKRIQDATGTVTRIFYDVRGLQTQIWVGTDDVPTTGFWSPTNNAGANMQLVSQNEYDRGLYSGNGNLTKTTRIPGGPPGTV